MATVTDLTFEAINNAAIADSSIGQAIFSITGDTISLNVKTLTGDSFSGLTDEGVLEFMYKLRKLCSDAQATVNELVATDPSEELNSFPPFTFGIPSADGLVEVSQVQSMFIPLASNSVKGIN